MERDGGRKMWWKREWIENNERDDGVLTSQEAWIQGHGTNGCGRKEATWLLTSDKTQSYEHNMRGLFSSLSFLLSFSLFHSLSKDSGREKQMKKDDGQEIDLLVLCVQLVMVLTTWPNTFFLLDTKILHPIRHVCWNQVSCRVVCSNTQFKNMPLVSNSFSTGVFKSLLLLLMQRERRKFNYTSYPFGISDLSWTSSIRHFRFVLNFIHSAFQICLEFHPVFVCCTRNERRFLKSVKRVFSFPLSFPLLFLSFPFDLLSAHLMCVHSELRVRVINVRENSREIEGRKREKRETESERKENLIEWCWWFENWFVYIFHFTKQGECLMGETFLLREKTKKKRRRGRRGRRKMETERKMRKERWIKEKEERKMVKEEGMGGGGRWDVLQCTAQPNCWWW